MSEMDWSAIWESTWLTLRLAGATTLVLMLIGLPLAWWLAHWQSRFKVVFEAIVALPLVLPPTVLGFYLLFLFAPNSPLGSAWFSLTGTTLAFSFGGMLLGSILYSFPFVIQPLQNAFEQQGRTWIEAGAMLGAGPWERFFRISLPMARKSLLTAACLGFAHTLGEFGVVLMVGGNIPGETRVLSIAIFDAVESLDYAQAHLLSLGLLVVSMVLLLVIYGLNRQFSLRGHHD